MSDYISREAALKLRTGCNRDCETCGFAVELDSWCRGEVFVVNLLGLPAADVRPVVRGEWTTKRTLEHDGEWWCTACGNEVSICSCGKDRTWKYRYCPICGAEMRPKEADDAEAEKTI